MIDSLWLIPVYLIGTFLGYKLGSSAIAVRFSSAACRVLREEISVMSDDEARGAMIAMGRVSDIAHREQHYEPHIASLRRASTKQTTEAVGG